MAQVNSKEYRSHGVFRDLARYIEFYKNLATSIMHFSTVGTTSVINIDTYAFSSMQGTLDSMREILLSGRINDAYALLRKYYDSLVINVYANLYLEEHVGVENFIVLKVQEWLSGDAQLPKYKVMLKYIGNSRRVNPVTIILLSDQRYREIRDRCNAHIHYKFYEHVLLNNNEIYLPNRREVLDVWRSDVRNLFIMHLAYVFFIKQKYMMSSDYIDALECGISPEAGSQYWVAPFVQEVFDDIITPFRPEITSAVRDSSAMELS